MADKETKPRASRTTTPKASTPPAQGEMDIMMGALDNLDFGLGASPAAEAAKPNGTAATIPVEQVNLANTPGHLTEKDLVAAKGTMAVLQVDQNVYLDQLKVQLAGLDKKLDSLLKGNADLTGMAQGPQQALTTVGELLTKLAAALKQIDTRLQSLEAKATDTGEAMINLRDTTLDFLDAVNRLNGDQLVSEGVPGESRSDIKTGVVVSVAPTAITVESVDGLSQKLLENIKSQTQVISAVIYAKKVAEMMAATGVTEKEVMSWMQRMAQIDPAGNLIKG